MLDLSAAFGALDHSIMLSRLQNQFGIKNTALKWFTSYFHNRTSHVTISGADSDESHIPLDVPQGSYSWSSHLHRVLASHVGDIIRSTYMSHVPHDDIQIYMYMDFDPSIPNDAACALFTLSNCITDAQKWLITNKLLLNNDKTEFFIATSPHHQRGLSHLTLNVITQQLSHIKEFKI